MKFKIPLPSFEWFRKLHEIQFIKQIAVIVISISLTLTANSWFEQRARKSYIEQTLALVRSELKENLRNFEEAVYHMEATQKAFANLYGSRDTIAKLHPDTLKDWISNTTYSQPCQLYTYAFDVLKSSAAYEELDNGILIFLSRVYGSCKAQTIAADYYFTVSKNCSEELSNQLYAHYNKGKITGHEVYTIAKTIPQFRTRLFNRSIHDVYIQSTQDAVLYLENSILKLESIMKNEGYNINPNY